MKCICNNCEYHEMDEDVLGDLYCYCSKGHSDLHIDCGCTPWHKGEEIDCSDYEAIVNYGLDGRVHQVVRE